MQEISSRLTGSSARLTISGMNPPSAPILDRFQTSLRSQLEAEGASDKIIDVSRSHLSEIHSAMDGLLQVEHAVSSSWEAMRHN